MSVFRTLLVAAAGFGALGCAGAQAATLSWSHAGGVIGYCNFSLGHGACNQPGRGDWVVTDGGQIGGPNQNVSGYLSDSWGSVYGAADAGDVEYGLPQLHAAVTVGPNQLPLVGRSTVQVQALQKYTWTGEAIDIDPNDLVGTMDYSASGGGTNSVGVGFAIIDDSLIGNPELGSLYYRVGTNGMFAADCSTPGAVAIANPNRYNGSGDVSFSVAATACGPLHLDTGDTFFVWAKLGIFRGSQGYIDASHTFSLGFAPDVTPEQQAFFLANVETSSFNIATPEPGTWALMLAGFGLAGATLRRRRRGAVAA